MHCVRSCWSALHPVVLSNNSLLEAPGIWHQREDFQVSDSPLQLPVPLQSSIVHFRAIRMCTFQALLLWENEIYLEYNPKEQIRRDFILKDTHKGISSGSVFIECLDCLWDPSPWFAINVFSYTSRAFLQGHVFCHRIESSQACYSCIQAHTEPRSSRCVLYRVGDHCHSWLPAFTLSSSKQPAGMERQRPILKVFVLSRKKAKKVIF